jgi:FAD/FMN-containing dehydrogenase
MTASLLPPPETYFAPTCEVISPTADIDIHNLIGRWSGERLSKPALIVIPSTQEDIVAAIQYAAANKLQLLPGAGGHKIVPINERTLYLDMRKLKDIAVDTDRQTVTFGGGVTNQEVLEACAVKRLYTSEYSNSYSKSTK